MTYHFGLTGHPLGHSLSPRIHTAALAACNLAGDYTLFPVSPDDPAGLADLLARVRSGEIHGLNVTIPHKQNIIPLLDELTETARIIGAVNTIFVRDGRLIGDNTDAAGFLSDLNRFLEQASPAGQKTALVLGAGGSARAVVYALLHDGWKVTLAARRLEQAQQLAASFPHAELHTTRLDDFQPLSLDLLVNTTPLGMTPHIDTTPWERPFPTNSSVYDLVYNPRETRLVRAARAEGHPATTGLGMLIGQAALAFETWTGFVADRESMRKAVA